MARFSVASGGRGGGLEGGGGCVTAGHVEVTCAPTTVEVVMPALRTVTDGVPYTDLGISLFSKPFLYLLLFGFFLGNAGQNRFRFKRYLQCVYLTILCLYYGHKKCQMLVLGLQRLMTHQIYISIEELLPIKWERFPLS